MDKLFETVLENGSLVGIGVGEFVICVVAALVMGMIIGVTYMYKSNYTKSFVVTLALLPAIVCVVIMMVNGNLGAGVAVAGAFSLVRFRSVPGTAKEICVIFLAMAVGLMTGMGFVGYGVLFTIILCAVNLIYNATPFGVKKVDMRKKVLKITIPEELDYTEVFDELFEKYTDKCELIQVKTTNMGSMFKLSYNIELKSLDTEKEFIDKLRCRNGNLEVMISRIETMVNEL